MARTSKEAPDGAKLLSLLDDHNISQRRLAKEMGVGPTSVSRYVEQLNSGGLADDIWYSLVQTLERLGISDARSIRPVSEAHGVRLLSLLASHNVTQQRLGRELGVTPTTIGRYIEQLDEGTLSDEAWYEIVRSLRQLGISDAESIRPLRATDGIRLRTLLDEHGISKNRLAREMDRTPTSITRYIEQMDAGKLSDDVWWEIVQALKRIGVDAETIRPAMAPATKVPTRLIKEVGSFDSREQIQRIINILDGEDDERAVLRVFLDGRLKSLA